ncbi:DUF4124 domain-containing protein [Methylophaga lonarensis]|uniref:DUF4124 domain-containing protein n=1 Tax=Methylophaga lonarensis TaxID=999151 RepID=UPI003D2D1056
MPSAYITRMIVIVMIVMPSMLLADIYRWTDDDGIVSYSQTAPTDRPSETVETPPPPPLDDNAVREIRQLIQSQRDSSESRQQQREQQQQALQQRQQRDENCQIARENRQLFLDNPNRRFMDSDGNFQRFSEEQRQQRLDELQQQIDTICQP